MTATEVTEAREALAQWRDVYDMTKPEVVGQRLANALEALLATGPEVSADSIRRALAIEARPTDGDDATTRAIAGGFNLARSAFRRELVGRCRSRSPHYEGSHGYETCFLEAGHDPKEHTGGSRRWSSDPDRPCGLPTCTGYWGHDGPCTPRTTRRTAHDLPAEPGRAPVQAARREH